MSLSADELPVFHNQKIDSTSLSKLALSCRAQRSDFLDAASAVGRLSLEAKRVFFGDLVASGPYPTEQPEAVDVCVASRTDDVQPCHSAGHGLWLDKQQDSCLVLWKSLDAWAQTLRQWARSVGMQDSVTTLDDLSTGAEVVGTGKLPPKMLALGVRIERRKPA